MQGVAAEGTWGTVGCRAWCAAARRGERKGHHQACAARRIPSPPTSRLPRRPHTPAGADWEGVVLIPFIDQDRLLTAAASVPPERLTAEERARNTLGDILVFLHAPGAIAQAGLESAVGWAQGRPCRPLPRALAHGRHPCCPPAPLLRCRRVWRDGPLPVHPARPLCVRAEPQQPRRVAGGAAAAARRRPRLHSRGGWAAAARILRGGGRLPGRCHLASARPLPPFFCQAAATLLLPGRCTRLPSLLTTVCGGNQDRQQRPPWLPLPGHHQEHRCGKVAGRWWAPDMPACQPLSGRCWLNGCTSRHRHPLPCHTHLPSTPLASRPPHNAHTLAPCPRLPQPSCARSGSTCLAWPAARSRSF